MLLVFVRSRPGSQAFEQPMAAAVGAGLPVQVRHLTHDYEADGERVRALEAELSFYGQVFGFPIADAVAPLHIDNLPAR